MMTVYCRSGDCLVARPAAGLAGLPAGALWLDLDQPTHEEDRLVEAWLGISVPTREDMGEIEESSRFYKEGDAQYLTMPVLHGSDDGVPGIAPVTFVLKPPVLVTVRYTQPRSLALYLSRATKAGTAQVPETADGVTVLLGLLEAITDRMADILENVSMEFDKASIAIFRRPKASRPMTTQEFRELLTRIGAEGTFLGKVRESLSGLDRLLLYLDVVRNPKSTSKELASRIKSIERDTRSLESYVDFLSNKSTFLLDTVVGLVSIEQNAIIKIFSVAAVGFMPPTLVASIYGMNFHDMPELSWSWGYPTAILAMIASAAIPLWLFRRKGWL